MTTATVAAHRPSASDRTRRIRAVARLAGTDLRLMTREPAVVVGTLAFPLVSVLVLAGVFGHTVDPDFGNVAPDAHYVVGYIGVVLASLGVITIPVHIATNRQLGVLRRFRAAGLDAGSVVAGNLVVGAVLAVACATIVVAVGAAVYGVPVPHHPLALFGWFTIGLLCFLAIGCALGSITRTGRAASAIGNLVFVPMFLLGGGGPPRKVMTPTMQHISDAFPLSDIIGGIRQSWLGTTADHHRLWYPVTIAAIATAIAVRNGRRPDHTTA